MSIQARTVQVNGTTAGVTASIDANGMIRAVHLKPNTDAYTTRPLDDYLCTLKYQDAVIGVSPTGSRTASSIWYPGGVTAGLFVSSPVAGNVDVILTSIGINGIVTVTLLVEQ